jgi:thimet oligopeptidase
MLHSDRYVKQAERAGERFRTECLEGLRRAQALRPEILAAPRTTSGALALYNQLLTAASASNTLAGLMSEAHPDEAIRDIARECEQEVARFYSELWLDREIYDAIAAIEASSAAAGDDPETRRFLAHTLRDYRRAGVDRPAEVRARLAQIDEELTKLGQQFSKNISEDVRSIEAPPSRLGGLPPDFLAAHPPNNKNLDIFSIPFHLTELFVCQIQYLFCQQSQHLPIPFRLCQQLIRVAYEGIQQHIGGA